MSVRDIPVVAELDRLIFGRSAWSAAAFAGELTESRISLLYLLSRGSAAPVTMRTLLGYFVCWTLPNQLHLANFAVHPNQRRQGLGALLLQALFRLGQRLEIETIELEVRQSNLAAQRLYRRHGFEPVGERPDFYEDPRETAILMDGPVPEPPGASLPAALASSYPAGLYLDWRDRAGESREHWPTAAGRAPQAGKSDTSATL